MNFLSYTFLEPNQMFTDFIFNIYPCIGEIPGIDRCRLWSGRVASKLSWEPGAGQGAGLARQWRGVKRTDWIIPRWWFGCCCAGFTSEVRRTEQTALTKWLLLSGRAPWLLDWSKWTVGRLLTCQFYMDGCSRIGNELVGVREGGVFGPLSWTWWLWVLQSPRETKTERHRTFLRKISDCHLLFVGIIPVRIADESSSFGFPISFLS